MPVYVDPLRNWGWRLGPSCHLVADTVEELHAFAARLGLKRAWFQQKSWPHYDLTASKRALAVELGAEELETREFAEQMSRWRAEAVALIQSAATREQQQAIREGIFGKPEE